MAHNMHIGMPEKAFVDLACTTEIDDGQAKLIPLVHDYRYEDIGLSHGLVAKN